MALERHGPRHPCHPPILTVSDSLALWMVQASVLLQAHGAASAMHLQALKFREIPAVDEEDVPTPQGLTQCLHNGTQCHERASQDAQLTVCALSTECH